MNKKKVCSLIYLLLKILESNEQNVSIIFLRNYQILEEVTSTVWFLPEDFVVKGLGVVIGTLVAEVSGVRSEKKRVLSNISNQII